MDKYLMDTPARYWKAMDDGRLLCTLCPRACKIRNGQHGLCFVRANQNGQMILKTYGRASGFCVDPIEKKPLNHFLPGTPVLSFGTAGCNLTCKFCQNWDISKSREFDKLQAYADPETIASIAEKTGSRSVAFTYNDPVIFLEYAVDIAKACRTRNIKTIAVTAGYICKEARAEFFSHMDAVNVDLKAFTEDFYHTLCTGHLEDVKETLVYLKHHTNIWFEITTLLIPNENDSPKEINAMTKWIVSTLGPDIPVHFSAFHPDWRMKDKPYTPHQTLIQARKIALKNGVRHAYIGNVHDPERESTYCDACGTILIGRNRYRLFAWALTDDGKCRTCGVPCAGRFDGLPGTWGEKRMSIKL